MKKKYKCQHDWVFIDKWYNQGKTFWEFHCRYCLAIETIMQSDEDFSKKVDGRWKNRRPI